jgi:hypothetical protein
MKKFFVFLTLISLLSLFGCSTEDNESKRNGRITKLNVISGNSAYVTQSDSSLAQIGQVGNPSLNIIGTQSMAILDPSLTSITDNNGNIVKITDMVQVNSNYAIIAGLTEVEGNTTPEDVILDLTTGDVTILDNSPDSLHRAYANSTDVFYTSSGSIYEVNLSTGNATIVSSNSPFWGWHQNYTVFDNSDISEWHNQCWIYVDENSNLYAISCELIVEGKPIGMAEKFSKIGGTWVRDEILGQTFFPTMPASSVDEIPGSSLIMKNWIIIDQETSKLYRISIDKSNFNVYAYNIETWSNKSLAASIVLSHSISDTTYLGYNDTIQSSIITDGQSIITLTSDEGNITVTEIPNNYPIPYTNTVGTPGIDASPFPKGGVTNWKYLNASIYYLDPSDNNIYSWKLTGDPVLVTDSMNINFIY